MLSTIGYEKADLDDFLATLKMVGVEVLVDIRERAQSRRKGYSKTALARAVEEIGIEYIHFKALGDPKAGRDAAKAGKMELFKEIFLEAMDREQAREAFDEVRSLAAAKRICLLCYERDHHSCHRKIVADRLESSLGCEVVHLGVNPNAKRDGNQRRVFHTCESAAAQI